MHPVLKKHYKEGKLAHAYLFVGPKEPSVKSIYEFANFFFGSSASFKEKAHLSSNPDFFEYLGNKFGIDDAHALRRQALLKGFSTQGKIFLIDADSFTYEAMPALLKIFEEPPQKTLFFLISERPYSLLPTLRSRLTLINFGNHGDTLSDVKKDSIKKFLKMSAPKRLLYLKALAEDRDRSLDFLRALETILVSSFEKDIGEKKDFSYNHFLKEISELEVMLSERSSLPRLILQHIALTLPWLQ